MRAAVLVLLLTTALTTAADEKEVVFQSFDDADSLSSFAQNHAQAELVPVDKGQALRVVFEKTDWPNVFFAAPEGEPWDWSAHGGLALDVTNPESEPVEVCIRIDNAGADGMKHCITARANIDAGSTTTFRAQFPVQAGRFWGMRGVPVRGTVTQGADIDPSKIVAFQVFLPTPDKPHTLLLDNIRLFGRGGPLEDLVPLPFIDRFGQYKHADWPGKLHDEAEWVERRQREAKEYATAPELPGLDRFGGSLEGPRLDATGWFRVEKVDGKWWFVTPEGHVFFSTGMDCVNMFDATFVDGRDGWFEWLPEPDGPLKDCFGYTAGVHSMAEPIEGKGRTFNWYRANLQRKYGEAWRVAWQDTTLARLRSWGFNTIGNWSQEDIIDRNIMPYTATCGSGDKVRLVEGGAGYWGKMKDVYDIDWEKSVDEAIAAAARKHATNPMCIGFFVDNELSWGSSSGYEIAAWSLASPGSQASRFELVKRLEAKYGSIDALNKAWETTTSNWDELRAPAKPNSACAADLDAFVYDFARKYFESIKAALRKHAPNQLYLGCRFSTASRSVIRACADVSDVVSFNIYRRGIDPKQWTGENDLGKPILIGEFHFGSLDRGMFHTGLVPTRDQADRAEHYARYVESVADCPAFVGCHWFQYVDEPTTGRVYDGENYNIGFVTVTDTPYPELVAAARQVHGQIYARRLGKSGK